MPLNVSTAYLLNIFLVPLQQFTVHVTEGNFAVFGLRFASARRSAFLRRAARFLTLSLPWLCPIIPNTLPLTSNLKHQKFFGDRYARPARPRLFSGGAVENAAHFAHGEIEDDAAVDRTHDKGAIGT
jgi:hypothetical protein